MSRRKGPPGRETAAATSRTRRTWYGYGSLARSEKSGFGVFLHDTTRIFAEVSVFSLPTLVYIMTVPPAGPLDAEATGLLAWLTMTLVGTLIRGGWITPLLSATPGWVSLSPVLLLLRLGYFNVTMATAAFGGLTLGNAVWPVVDVVWPVVGVGWAIGSAALAILLFPRVAQAVAAR
ncbi:hypothetical protein JCM18237_09580 [Halorubrum luteum]